MTVKNMQACVPCFADQADCCLVHHTSISHSVMDVAYDLLLHQINAKKAYIKHSNQLQIIMG